MWIWGFTQLLLNQRHVSELTCHRTDIRHTDQASLTAQRSELGTSIHIFCSNLKCDINGVVLENMNTLDWSSRRVSINEMDL